ncbi:YagK/YfjJ domain-containing protein [Pseudomonas syringae]|uniref:YagK/YfjJ domain-containing protein n=1 Tax=Pseudomonas syringae TaxID=317 RepID=UPI003F74DCEB
MRFQSARENTFSRLRAAWASALGIPVDDTNGLVHIPDNAGYDLSQDDLAELDRYFRRASHPCQMGLRSVRDMAACEYPSSRV